MHYPMDHSYPAFTNSHSSSDAISMNSDSSLGRHSPYQRFLSPSPTRSSIRQRSSSISYSNYSYFFDASQYNRGRRHTGKNVRESQLVNPDIIDRLDSTARYYYHHEGPYDAVYPERNKYSSQSPVEALRESNAEALKATPKHKIADSIKRHRPLDGVAYYPPGHTDQEGQTYNYEEGYNMMTDYGNFARFPGLKFTDEDFKKDPFYNTPTKPFAPIRNAFRRKHRLST